MNILDKYICIHIYVHTHISTHTYMHVYIYVCDENERKRVYQSWDAMGAVGHKVPGGSLEKGKLGENCCNI